MVFYFHFIFNYYISLRLIEKLAHRNTKILALERVNLSARTHDLPQIAQSRTSDFNVLYGVCAHSARKHTQTDLVDNKTKY